MKLRPPLRSLPARSACYAAASHCASGARDGDESDVDCGGSCAPCARANASCAVDADCYHAECGPARGGRRACAVPPKPSSMRR